MSDVEHEDRVRKVTEVFDELRRNGRSNEDIFVEAYEGLKQLARKMVSNQPAGTSMHATRLLSDLFVKLFEKRPAEFEWQCGQEFYYAVTSAMHHLLIDYIRRKNAAKRGGGKVGSLDELFELGVEVVPDLGIAKNRNWFEERARQALEWNEALQRLRQENPRRAEILFLTYYGDLSREEVAATLSVSQETINKELQKGRARIKYYHSGIR